MDRLLDEFRLKVLVVIRAERAQGSLRLFEDVTSVMTSDVKQRMGMERRLIIRTRYPQVEHSGSTCG